MVNNFPKKEEQHILMHIRLKSLLTIQAIYNKIEKLKE
jgi:hypothetical protein